jgi:uncharacterized Zn-binding protein involved in type VI secretion
MGKPAARQGDKIVATDTHIVMIPTPGGPVPTPLPNPFIGQLDGQLSSDVMIDGKAAAVVGSTATNSPSHIPSGGPFQSPPKNKGTVKMGSNTVLINGKGAARLGDTADTCNDPSDLPVGTVVSGSPTVLIGD